MANRDAQRQLQFVAAITGGENGIRPCIIIVLTMERRGPSVVGRHTLHRPPTKVEDLRPWLKALNK